jgi:hypothetical protein
MYKIIIGVIFSITLFFKVELDLIKLGNVHIKDIM